MRGRDHDDEPELVDIAAEELRSTDRAYHLDDGKSQEWCPKSLTQRNGDGTFTMPLWLAKDKGFI